MMWFSWSWLWYTVVISTCVSLCPCFCYSHLPSLMDRDVGGRWKDFGLVTGNESPQIPEDFVHKRIYEAFEEYNKELQIYSHEGALIAWNITENMSPETLEENEKFTIEKNIWNNHWCGELQKVYHDPDFGHSSYPWDMSHLRQLYLICRGPRFSSYQLTNVLGVLGNLQQLYNKNVCIPSIGKCLRMEPDLNHYMEWTRDEAKLREAWIAWHKTIGSEVKPLYAGLIRMLNTGAKQAGFSDMGQCWRDEMEIGELREVVTKLYSDVKYLYTLLHAFVRHKLEKYYGMEFHNGLIPSHLLGNMWAQKWDSLMDIVTREDDDLTNKNKMSPGGIKIQSSGSFDSMRTSSQSSGSLVSKILPRNATVVDMVKAAESFFVSMGLPNLPESFWENSYFQDANSEEGKKEKRKANSRNCHGSAANMYDGKGRGDYRMLMCAQVNDEDLITIHHEIGHILYFIAYSKLPTIFQDGANSAFHESVGDSITYDLIHFQQQEDEKNRIRSLLKTGLAKLPQIGFGLIMDLWRWELFENPNRVSEWNDLWWKMNENFLGITRPTPDYNIDGEALDAAGKFHIIDNIPYIRYFFASFLQLQFFEAMCNVSETGMNRNLHDCQIRGSKQAGNLLWNMMGKGTSLKWSEILKEMTGSNQIESKALLNYFEPLRVWLESEIRRLGINSIGW